ncbi:hypothetical protein X875_7890 [Mannheimia varigena USDA-ARS-USMARC-1388]|uniref:DUF5358 family protein n=1 Tax=Mannheimia varigena TaxID=85404 RepID=UPI0003E362D8|nr:DUF5358 family protein [Mannheimia varigena]AHG79407.1 hypothetical protein X875_7890 [Mannheimia varigena USDA-ARS-USMARC-1388]
MLKKALIVLLFSSSFAFANNLENLTAYNEPKYKISELDVKILIRQLNNLEQCIYPDLAKPDYQKIYDNWNVAEHLTIQYFEQRVLNDLLGREDFLAMQNDKASIEYFHQQHHKLNHQKANVDQEKCDAFKPTYQEMYQRMQNALAEQQKKKQ